MSIKICLFENKISTGAFFSSIGITTWAQNNLFLLNNFHERGAEPGRLQEGGALGGRFVTTYQGRVIINAACFCYLVIDRYP